MRHVVLVIALMSAVSCADDSGDSPAGPSPPLRSAVFSLTGTVSETFPTESTLIAGATITAVAGLETDGLSATSDASGVFQLTGLAPKTYTVRVRAKNYAESSQPLTLTGNQTLAVQLDPVFQMVTTTREDAITAHGSCAGPWDPGAPCVEQYGFAVHHDGTLTAELVWTDREVGFFTSLYRAERGLPVGQPIDLRVDDRGRFIYEVAARTQYVIQVNAFTETYMTPSRVTPYTVTLTHPN